MSDTNPTVEPRLPQDLERVIFELAAYNERRSIPVLMRVARRVRTWLEPVLYEIVILPSEGQEHRGGDDPDTEFYLCFTQLPEEPQTRHVRHLLIQGERQTAHETLLPQCYNLQDLALWNNSSLTAFPHLSSIIHSPDRTVSPRGLLRLSVPLKDLFPDEYVDFNHEILRDLTHLEVTSSLDEWEEGNNLACLKKLRYLSFPDVYSGQSETIKKCLEKCEALEVVVVYQLEGHPTFIDVEELPKVRRKVGLEGIVEELPEDRVVLFSCEETGDDCFSWFGNWMKGIVGGEDLWAKAERIVEERRQSQELVNSLKSIHIS